MTTIFTLNGDTFHLDPTGYWKRNNSKATDTNLLDTGGLLVAWLNDAAEEGEDLREGLDKRYGFGLYEIKGGKVGDQGIFSYPGDPDLHPTFKFETQDGQRFYMYPHSICAFERPGEPIFVTRMD